MRERLDTWLRERPLLVDVAIVAVLGLIPLVQLTSGQGLQFAADLVLLAPLVLRRVAPVLSFLGVALALFAQVQLSDAPRFGDVALLFGLYAIAAYGPTWAQWAGLATGLLGAGMAAVDWSANGTVRGVWGSAVALVAVVLVPWTLGGLMRTRRSYIAGLEERAQQLERDAVQQAQIAAASERARIAREMHDVVAHSLSVIVVQADGAIYASARRPEAAVETLSTISATGRQSLAEMRNLLGLLRGDGPASDQGRAPVPTGTDLPRLVEQVQASGLRVGLHTSGDLEALSAATGLTVYRVVQEALTNTLKHAGPDVTADVEVAVTDDEVMIQVEDDGRGAAAPDGGGGGHGIRGIGERIAVHEGHVETGARPGGGFRVRAVLPRREEARR